MAKLMTTHARDCQFAKVTLYVAVQDYGGIPRHCPLDYIIPALEKNTEVMVLDSASVELQLAPVEEDN